MSRDDRNGGGLRNGQGSSSIPDEERSKILQVALERMVLIDGKVYGLEDAAERDAEADCGAMLSSCRAVCCTYLFALTREEASNGFVRYNAERPYYIARDPDGYCPHLDRGSLKCLIYERRPLRCRKYACKECGREARSLIALRMRIDENIATGRKR